MTHLIATPPALAAAISQSGLSGPLSESLITAFEPKFSAAIELVGRAGTINVTDATQVSEMKAARAARLALREVRVDAEKIRKAMKEDYLRGGKAIDNVYRALETFVAPVEERLEACEKFAERAEAARKDALRAERAAILTPLVGSPVALDLATISADEFEALRAHHAQQAEIRRQDAQRAADAARLAEEARQQQLREAQAEQARLRTENLRLAAQRKEAAELMERAEQARREAEAEAARAKQETARRLEAAQQEMQRVKRIEAEQARQAAEDARRAASAPDREKLKAFAKAMRNALNIDLPVLTEQHAEDVLYTFIDRLGAELDQFERAIAGA
jgi:hypothetical protein